MYVAVILGMHLLLAAGFMLYFFHMPHFDPVPNPVTTSTTTTLAPVNVKSDHLNINASKST